VAVYRLTIRHGSRVAKERFEDLDRAIEAMEQGVREVRREGPLREVKAFREYRPDRLVHARLELSTGGLLRGREAGIDVMGDGTLVAYVGVVRKRVLEPRDAETAFDAVREALGGGRLRSRP
jgi:hypothetical protein